jgi:hypothetical protein
MNFRRWSLACVVAAAAYSAACSDDVEVGANSRLPTASGGTGGAFGSGGSGGSIDCVPRTCKGEALQCGNCKDDDGDGLIDAADSECLGPCDDKEDSFFGLPPSSNAPCRQDCYFDSNSGFGNDCHWSHRCDPKSLEPGFPPSADLRCSYDPAAMIPGTTASCTDLAATQSDSCLDSCLPLTPNGCDCFGCCELPAGSGQYAWLGSTDNGVPSCDRAHVDDPTKCRPCTPISVCLNRCEPCEVCVGRPANDPRSCSDAGTGPEPAQCAPGVRACGREGQPLCGANQYCITGCCVTIPA